MKFWHNAVWRHFLLEIFDRGGFVAVQSVEDHDAMFFELPRREFRFARTIPGTTTIEWKPAPCIVQRTCGLGRAYVGHRTGAASGLHLPLTVGVIGSGAGVQFERMGWFRDEEARLESFRLTVEWEVPPPPRRSGPIRDEQGFRRS